MSVLQAPWLELPQLRNKPRKLNRRFLRRMSFQTAIRFGICARNISTARGIGQKSGVTILRLPILTGSFPNELRFYPSDESLPTAVEVSRDLNAQGSEDDLAIPGELDVEDLVRSVAPVTIEKVPQNSYLSQRRACI